MLREARTLAASDEGLSKTLWGKPAAQRPFLLGQGRGGQELDPVIIHRHRDRALLKLTEAPGEEGAEPLVNLAPGKGVEEKVIALPAFQMSRSRAPGVGRADGSL